MFETYVSPNCKIAVSFESGYKHIDPRSTYKHSPLSGRPNSQYVTMALIRPLDGPKTLFVGAAVCSPEDGNVVEVGQKIALTRALHQMLPDLELRECSQMARGILRAQALLERAQRVEIVVGEAVNA